MRLGISSSTLFPGSACVSDYIEKRLIILGQHDLIISDYTKNMHTNLMKTILVDAINGLIEEDGTIFQEMLELLEIYPNRKIILTGADYEANNLYSLNDAPYEVFTLKHNPEKSDPAYFTILLAYFGLDKEDVVYFEHAPQAVESAESVGIRSYYYENEKKDLEKLKAFFDGSL
jgi:hypothetical protein